MRHLPLWPSTVHSHTPIFPPLPSFAHKHSGFRPHLIGHSTQVKAFATSWWEVGKEEVEREVRTEAGCFWGRMWITSWQSHLFQAFLMESEAIKQLRPLFFNEVLHLDKHFKLRGNVAAARIRVLCKALMQSLAVLYPPHSMGSWVIWISIQPMAFWAFWFPSFLKTPLCHIYWHD